MKLIVIYLSGKLRYESRCITNLITKNGSLI